MRTVQSLLMLCILLAGCASVRTPATAHSRYDVVQKQTSYVSVNFPADPGDLKGKTKDEVRRLMGEPSGIRKARFGEQFHERWIYYPRQTNNFVAIIVTFEGDRVRDCQYESVM